MDVQVPNGVVDVLVPDEAAAVATAKQYLSYFSGPVDDCTAPDQALLRDVIPGNRLRVYDVHSAIDGLADTGSVLELRSQMRDVIPENRLRVYDVHSAIDGLADTGSVLELRSQFGVGMVAALIRVEGRPRG